MRSIRGLVAIVAGLGVAALSSAAHATFSIVAAEPGSGAFGSAGASCVPYEVIRILRVADGKGLLVGQAYFEDDALALGKAMLAEGEAPDAVLAAIRGAELARGEQRVVMSRAVVA